MIDYGIDRVVPRVRAYAPRKIIKKSILWFVLELAVWIVGIHLLSWYEEMNIRQMMVTNNISGIEQDISRTLATEVFDKESSNQGIDRNDKGIPTVNSLDREANANEAIAQTRGQEADVQDASTYTPNAEMTVTKVQELVITEEQIIETDATEEYETEEETETDLSEPLMIPVLTGLIYKGEIQSAYCLGAKKIEIAGLEINAQYSDGQLERIPLSECTLVNFKADTIGKHIGTIQYRNFEVNVPYEVKEYHVKFVLNGGAISGDRGVVSSLKNYKLEEVPIPLRRGYIFDGWYHDSEFTLPVEIPYIAAWGNEVTYLHAKWINAEPFTVVNGVIQSYQGENTRRLEIGQKDSYGLGRGIFNNYENKIEIIDIPSNITHIESGAFLGLTFLEEFIVKNNSVYTVRGVNALYTKDEKVLIAYAAGYKGTYTIDSGRTSMTEHVAAYAFYDSNLNTIVFNPTIKSIGAYAIGQNIKRVRFTGDMPPTIQARAFGSEIDTRDIIIEVPKKALQSYQEAFRGESAVLVNAVRGYE